MSFPLPAPGTTGQPFQFVTIPSNFATPSKLFFKNTEAAYVYDGSGVTKVADVDYPALTVPGVAYLNGRVYVMAPDGTIYGSDTFNPLSWLSTTIIAAKSEGDPAVALVRHLVYIVALKSNSSEFFLDQGLPAPGSPLAPMVNAFLEVGCAAAGSIAFSDNTVFFMSESLPRGRSIVRLDGMVNHVISTPFIDRILNSSTLAHVYAIVVKKNGHVFYALTMTDIALTIVYDDITKEWHRWTTLTVGTPRAVTITTVDGVTTANTGLITSWKDGDPSSVTYTSGGISYTETVAISYLSPTSFTFTLSLPADNGAATCTPWVESYFPGIFSTRGTNEDLLLSETGANVFGFDDALFQDVGQPINLKARTAIDDWGVMKTKRFNRLQLVGDIEETTVLVRFNDRDYGAAEWSLYRPINVTADLAQIGALGSAKRRAHEFRHYDNTAFRAVALEADFFVGPR